MANKEKKERQVRLPNVFEALIPIVVMMGLMLYGFIGDGAYVDAHMPLLISIVVACIIGCLCGHSFSDMLAGMLDRLNATMEAILIRFYGSYSKEKEALVLKTNNLTNPDKLSIGQQLIIPMDKAQQ